MCRSSAREFRRQEAGGIVNGDESGLGDLSLLGSWAAYIGVTENTITRLTLLGGLKLPSGNSRRLKEELRESDEVESGIHGHDLALGSGSVDGIVGAQLFWSLASPLPHRGGAVCAAHRGRL